MTDRIDLGEHTPGPWRAVPRGGSSTILSAVKPTRNDTRIPTYGYRENGEHCIAYPFLNDDGRTRLDFVCFSHEDAAHIVRCVNSHDDLLGAAKAFIDRWDRGDRADTDYVADLMKAAIARAEAR